MTRLLFALYGLLTYLFFFGTFLYAAAFVANIPGLKTMDTGPSGTLAEAIVVDLLLLGLFAVQHSVMARPAFKRWWTRFVPPPLERSTYVLFASAALEEHDLVKMFEGEYRDYRHRVGMLFPRLGTARAPQGGVEIGKAGQP